LKQIPTKLLQELQGVSGFDEAAFLAAHEHAPLTSVRINPAKDTAAFEGLVRVPWCSNGVYLSKRPVFTLDPVYHAGGYYVQEASSMFLQHVLSAIVKDKTGLRVLDLCAAPGGKSTLIASMLDKDSLLISNEVIRARATILDENMTRWGYMNTWVTSNDPREFAKFPGYFDIIVVDAPCSGSGLWRKDADALDEWSEANVQLCSERQQRILADVWPSLKQGGTLVYATCSYSIKEDEEVLDWIASTYDVAPVAVPLAEEWGIVPVSSVKGMMGYRFFPHKVQGEGFFIAAMQKNEESDTMRPARFKSANDKKVQAQAAYLLSETDLVYVQSDKEHFSAMRPQHEEDWQMLQKAVYLRKTGLKLGRGVAKEWLPEHEVAPSIDASKELPCINVTKEQALRFLKREEMGIDAVEKGWAIVRYNGLGLGWVKGLGNRVNNYLPKNWRIRMDIEV
jgi:NOL1/NOP2/sun family putative RNA methylase